MTTTSAAAAWTQTAPPPECYNRAPHTHNCSGAQAITYNLGKNAIIQLREAYRQARGSAYTPKEFHERFMKMGMIPPGYYRESFVAGARR